MESVLFVPSTRDTEWIQDVLPGKSPVELPVAGRNIMDYAFESARNIGAAFAEVLDGHFSEALFGEFSDLTRTGFPVFYVKGEGALPKGLADIEGLPTPLTETIADDLIVSWGLVVPGAKLTPDAALTPLSDKNVAETPPGIYRRQGGRWMAYPRTGFTIGDVRSWLLFNFCVIRNPGKFTLPGYSAEWGIHLGRNVVMEHGVNIKPPVLIGDDAWCARNVRLDGNVIVGERSFVGEGTRLIRTVVGDDTFIGDGLEFEDKIIIGSRIIDAKTGVWTDVEDPGVARPMHKAPGSPTWLKRLWWLIVGASHGRRG